jgi:peptidoglycan/xylan/chitin deacetylase (PgdA/CDA1 family)
MSLSEPMQNGSPPRVRMAPLAPTPSSFGRARSNALREVAARLLPRSVFFVHGARRVRRKRVALTFDDGPDALTTAYLDALDGLGVRATFFLIGEQAAQRPNDALEYVRRGHEVGGHGWTHDAFSAMSVSRLTKELARTSAILSPRAGNPVLVRPPRGLLSARALLCLASAGYVAVLWSLDSDDCRTRDPGVIEHRLAPSRIAPGEVVLLHEMQDWTLKALPRVVKTLRDAGYEFVTIGELMTEDGGGD